MADFKIGQLVTGEFEGIGIIVCKDYEDGDLMYTVQYRCSSWGNSFIDTYDQYADDLSAVKGVYEVELTALGVGSFVTQFKAKDEESAQKWISDFIAGDQKDVLDRPLTDLWSKGAKSKNLIVTYIKKVS